MNRAMMSLKDATELELREELDRRNIARPRPSAKPDFSSLIRMIVDGTNESAAKGFEVDDFEHYVFETAMTAVYGNSYWAWRKAQKW